MAKRKATTGAAKHPSEYWDSCVFLEILNKQGERGDVAATIFQDALHKRRTVYTSLLTITEVVFTLAENNGRIALKQEEAAAIDKLWHPQSPFRMVEFTKHIAVKAREIKRLCLEQKPAIPMFPSDAVHLACAQHRQVERFFTYDQFNRRPGDKDAALPDQRPNLSNLLGFEVCDPHARGLLAFKAKTNANAAEPHAVTNPPQASPDSH